MGIKVSRSCKIKIFRPDLFCIYTKRFYICTPFRSKLSESVPGEMGEWLKPPVC